MTEPASASFQDYAHFRDAVLFQLGPDYMRGFMSAYYRTFAIPQIARQLSAHGESLRNPAKRASDTGIVIYEIIYGGFESDRSKQMIQLLNHVHKGVAGTKEDYEYVLMSLLVIPAMYVAKRARRPLDVRELADGITFFSTLGQRMGIVSLPDSYPEWEETVLGYEAKFVSATQESVILTRASLPIFAGRLPTPLRGLAPRVLSALLGDLRVSRALGLPAPGWLGGLFLNLTRGRSSATESYFEPGAARSAEYPHGYSIEQVGPSAKKTAK